MSIEAMKQASDAILNVLAGGEFDNPLCDLKQAALALQQAIAKADKQEPYGYFRYDIRLDAWVQDREITQGVAFYTAPPKREWVGLTDEEVGRLTVFDGLHHVEVPILADFACAIEAKLKEKNT